MSGGLIRLFLEKRKSKSEHSKKEEINRGILYTSGLIAGEGLVGVLLAIFAIIPLSNGSLADFLNLSKFSLGKIGSIIFFIVLILTLLKATIWYKEKSKSA